MQKKEYIKEMEKKIRADNERYVHNYLHIQI